MAPKATSHDDFSSHRRRTAFFNKLLGFAWSAVRAGIKASGNLDLAVAPQGADAAVMFTTNQVVAAPITVGRRHTASTGGRVKAVLVNAGNANCASGEAGIRACNDTCRAAAIYSLLGSASLNAIDPEIYLQDVLERVADHPINKITELPHWNMPVATQKTPSSIR